MKRKWLLLPIIGLAGLLGISVLAKSGGGDKNAKKEPTAEVKKGSVAVQVIETGTLDAIKTVQVKSKVQGRLAKLFVEEGDRVVAGQLIAIIDPQETNLKVKQDRAQLRGAQKSVDRQAIEIAQRRITAQANYNQALHRLEQVRAEKVSQPKLTNSAILSAESQVRSLEQELQRLETSVQPNQRTSADTSLREAQSNLDLAKKDVARQEELFSKGFVAGREVDAAKNNVQVQQARLDSARASFDRLESQLKLDLQRQKEQLRQAQADLARARANTYQNQNKDEDYQSALNDVQKAKAALLDVQALIEGRAQSIASVDQLGASLSDSERQLRETEIRAPISGIVSKKAVQVGELVSALSGFSSGTTIVDIQDRSSMRVILNVNEIDTARLVTGMEAKIRIEAVPTKTYHGTISKIAPASNATGTSTTDTVVKYQVEVKMTDSDNQLRSGMSGRCTMDVSKHDNVLVLPQEFVGQEGDQAFVEIYDPKAKPGAKRTRKNVTLGLTTLSTAEIKSGLSAGEVVARPEYKGPDRKGAMQAGGDE